MSYELGVENGHHRYNRNNKEDEENLGFDCESRLQFGLKCMSEGDAARLQEILTEAECQAWDKAFKIFWEKRGQPLNPKGFGNLHFGKKGRPKKDNYEDFEEDYVESITRTI